MILSVFVFVRFGISANVGGEGVILSFGLFFFVLL